mmetsp:Transcript_19797/g.30091  ORF Transcript_19797/g.30091 Transcript_19797/m.30091 type:complete len:87 (+) Transcript_19797:771-1031(+)
MPGTSKQPKLPKRTTTTTDATWDRCLLEQDAQAVAKRLANARDMVLAETAPLVNMVDMVEPPRANAKVNTAMLAMRDVPETAFPTR